MERQPPPNSPVWRGVTFSNNATATHATEVEGDDNNFDSPTKIKDVSVSTGLKKEDGSRKALPQDLILVTS